MDEITPSPQEASSTAQVQEASVSPSEVTDSTVSQESTAHEVVTPVLSGDTKPNVQPIGPSDDTNDGASILDSVSALATGNATPEPVAQPVISINDTALVPANTSTILAKMEADVKTEEVKTESFFSRLKAKIAGVFKSDESYVKDKIQEGEAAVVKELTKLSAKVYPSDEQTVFVEQDADYGGAHTYHIQNCLGFVDGKTQYADSHQTIQFIQKNADGSIIPGVQSEQIIFMLLDRHAKLNAKFESPEYINMLHGLNMFITACENRVKERVARGVMGDLKK